LATRAEMLPNNHGRLTTSVCLFEDEVEIVIQINGKLRDRVKMPIVATDEELKAVALSNPKVQDRIAGKRFAK
jgi:Leucyl-tRNA synthetase